MILEEQRLLHEDLERLEQAIADRVLEEPKQIRDRLYRDHQIANFLDRFESQSTRLLEIYKDEDGERTKEIQSISTGDQFEEFYKQLHSIKDFHRRYPNEPVENLERAYKKRPPGENSAFSMDFDGIFTGEEGYGRFFDLTTHHETYLNLPGVKGARRIGYMQYLDQFDIFTPPQCPIKRPDKLTDEYFQYLGSLVNYLQEFLKKVRPLENLPRLFATFDEDFRIAWEHNEVDGWGAAAPSNDPDIPMTEGIGEGIWCRDCEKEFKNDNVYKAHLTGKKHMKNAEAKKVKPDFPATNGSTPHSGSKDLKKTKERAVAEREFRIKKLTSVMQTERADTKSNIERKAGMTERERQLEIQALYAESQEPMGPTEEDKDANGEEKIYNPLKLPLAWDGKPIPFWLYKLHGLGVELPCEICGNFVYMGRRAFEKHFNEARHVYGLKCLGITNTSLFREITGIEEALKLWDKIQRDKKQEKASNDNIVQMEDAEGNVMPEKVYYDLQKQGLL